PGLSDVGSGAGHQDDDGRPGPSHGAGDVASVSVPPVAEMAASASRSSETWSSVWAADRVTRRRAVPGGTVGGRMAGTQTPWARKVADAATARSSDPRTMGMMGLGCPGATRSI